MNEAIFGIGMGVGIGLLWKLWEVLLRIEGHLIAMREDL